MFPSWWPVKSYDAMSELEIQQLIQFNAIAESDAVTLYSKKHDISSFIGCCQHSNVTLADWLGAGDDEFSRIYGLPDIAKKALAQEVSLLAQQINRERTEQEQKLKLEQQTLNKGLDLGKANTSFGRIFGN
jgi:hypothetical protein